MTIPLLEGQAIQDIDDAVRVDGAIDFEMVQGDVIDHVQHLHGAAIDPPRHGPSGYLIPAEYAAACSHDHYAMACEIN